MLDYLPLPYNILLATEYQCILFVSDAPYTRYVLKWFLLCALTKDCISPPNATPKCHNVTDQYGTKMGSNCHRYDQAALNLIHLQYLFDPVEQGALRIGLVDHWVDGIGDSWQNVTNGTDKNGRVGDRNNDKRRKMRSSANDQVLNGSTFVNKVLERRDQRFLPYGEMFSVRRDSVINDTIILKC
ncbi:unnamed protein product [Bursaphelenchus okinawaensis]|uniref:Uncharacterized protein n=1 Tax=Bursaphelenchus okinawaensis TaxID=465554 RepID=A0A811KF17_9BILA|nr:unnamed protein product [Bursaphelenchus okinawaensis]CAG9100869.1 unnamed protein product [Bursaphelenchus okinawaensis]